MDFSGSHWQTATMTMYLYGTRCFINLHFIAHETEANSENSLESSLNRTPCSRTCSRQSAARSNARLVILFEPGTSVSQFYRYRYFFLPHNYPCCFFLSRMPQHSCCSPPAEVGVILYLISIVLYRTHRNSLRLYCCFQNFLRQTLIYWNPISFHRKYPLFPAVHFRQL